MTKTKRKNRSSKNKRGGVPLEGAEEALLELDRQNQREAYRFRARQERLDRRRENNYNILEARAPTLVALARQRARDAQNARRQRRVRALRENNDNVAIQPILHDEGGAPGIGGRRRRRKTKHKRNKKSRRRKRKNRSSKKPKTGGNLPDPPPRPRLRRNLRHVAVLPVPLNENYGNGAAAAAAAAAAFMPPPPRPVMHIGGEHMRTRHPRLFTLDRGWWRRWRWWWIQY